MVETYEISKDEWLRKIKENIEKKKKLTTKQIWWRAWCDIHRITKEKGNAREYTAELVWQPVKQIGHNDNMYFDRVNFVKQRNILYSVVKLNQETLETLMSGVTQFLTQNSEYQNYAFLIQTMTFSQLLLIALYKSFQNWGEYSVFFSLHPGLAQELYDFSIVMPDHSTRQLLYSLTTNLINYFENIDLQRKKNESYFFSDAFIRSRIDLIILEREHMTLQNFNVAMEAHKKFLESYKIFSKNETPLEVQKLTERETLSWQMVLVYLLIKILAFHMESFR